MTNITVHDGADTIGGTKIFVEEKGKGVFLDFGKNFKKYGAYYQDFLRDRSSRGINDLILLNLIPKLNIYRKDLIPSDLSLSSYPKLNIDAVILSHAHQDHFGNIGLLESNIPVVASPITITLLKGILDSSYSNLNIEVAYFSEKEAIDNDKKILKTVRKADIGRNFYSTVKSSEELREFVTAQAKKTKPIEGGGILDLNNLPTSFEIKSFEVDHSIYGATAYILSGDVSIAYSGDFRLHGKNAGKSKLFVNSAKDASILIMEGTRASRESSHIESEDIVFKNCLIAASEASDLVIANFTGRNIERLEIFQEIATNIGRKLVITAKIAYLLKALDKVDGSDRLKDILIYKELSPSKKYWEKLMIGSKEESNIYIDPSKISGNPSNYLLCFSFYDMKHILDIKPKSGTYIYSSSEAFDEETELDFVRFNNWLEYFGFKIHGFKIVEVKGRLQPSFTKGYHASGHVDRESIRWTIDTIDPDVVIPVHTNNPGWFVENFENVTLLKNGETLSI